MIGSYPGYFQQHFDSGKIGDNLASVFFGEPANSIACYGFVRGRYLEDESKARDACGLIEYTTRFLEIMRTNVHNYSIIFPIPESALPESRVKELESTFPLIDLMRDIADSRFAAGRDMIAFEENLHRRTERIARNFEAAGADERQTNAIRKHYPSTWNRERRPLIQTFAAEEQNIEGMLGALTQTVQALGLKFPDVLRYYRDHALPHIATQLDLFCQAVPEAKKQVLAEAEAHWPTEHREDFKLQAMANGADLDGVKIRAYATKSDNYRRLSNTEWQNQGRSMPSPKSP